MKTKIKKKETQKKVWKNESSSIRLFMFLIFVFLQEERVFPRKHFVCSRVRIKLLIDIKTRGKRKWRLSFSGYDVVKCKHGEDCYVNMPESKRSFIQKCLFFRKYFSNFFFIPPPFLVEISTKNTHESINNSYVYVLVLLL